MAHLRALRITPRARRDIAIVLVRSEREFGPAARDRYQAAIHRGISTLLRDPNAPGSAARNELQGGIRTYHLRHARRSPEGRDSVARPRHLIVYRASDDELAILRLLHDSMELGRHIRRDLADD